MFARLVRNWLQLYSTVKVYLPLHIPVTGLPDINHAPGCEYQALSKGGYRLRVKIRPSLLGLPGFLYNGVGLEKNGILYP